METPTQRPTPEQLERRANLVRQRTMMALAAAGGGHVGGSLSAVDVLTALYFAVLRVDPHNPRWPDRDRFILSKGHASAALCAVLAEAGFFSPDLLANFNRLDSPFAMHPDMRKIPGVDMSTGALGHGLSVGVGMALAGRLQNQAYRVYVMLGDGELCEGSNWEAAMSASHFHLDSLVALVDRNRLMLDGPTDRIMSAEPLADKWRSFGWSVREIDGHDMAQIVSTLDEVPFATGQPSAIVAHTVKGKGVSSVENVTEAHHQPVDQALLARALEELRAGQAGGER